jgi:APA family basic amino acid/polyamine antiporter
MTTTDNSPAYLRRLGVWDGAMIVVGGVIGAGIFRTPATVAERTASGLPLLALWVLGGALTLAGVLCYAELGARRPQAGGIYLYLREAFGMLPAFLFGWTMALINYPGSVAAVAITFADYLCKAAGLSTAWVTPVGVAAIVFIVGVNFTGIRAGAMLQNVFAVLKLAAVALLVAVGLVLAHGHLGGVLATDTSRTVSSGAFVGALLPVLFTYGGFHYLNDLAGEVRDPQRTLPRALLLGMLGVVAAYVLANVAYLTGMGHAGLAASTAPAADLMHRLFGTAGEKVMAIGIACSTFGYCSIAIAGGARVLQTMGADGALFRAVGRIDAGEPRAARGAGAAGRLDHRADAVGQLRPAGGLHHRGRVAGPRLRHRHAVLVPLEVRGRAGAVPRAVVSAAAPAVRGHRARRDRRHRRRHPARCRHEPRHHRAGRAGVLCCGEGGSDGRSA